MADLKKIRVLCESKGLTLNDLAKKVGITPGGLQRILNENTTKVETLEKISAELGVPINSFFPEQDEIIIEKINKLESSVDEVIFQRDQFRRLYEEQASKIMIYRYLLRLIDKNIKKLVKREDEISDELRKSLTNIELTIDFLRSYDHSYISIKENDDQLSTWIQESKLPHQP